MKEFRLDSGEKIATGWIGASDARSVPAGVHAAASVSDMPGGESAGRGPLRTGLRFLYNAAIGLALLTVVPFAVVGWVGANGPARNTSGVAERLADAERLRPLMAPKDLAISPMQAGLALHALQSQRPDARFPMRAVGTQLGRPWKERTVTAGMFAVRSPGSDAPAANWVIMAAARGFSADEMSYLRAVAEAPIWREFDRVASAPAVDVIGGQYVLPFPADAFAPGMPVLKFADTKQMAYAGVSRAAYYVAIGQHDRAEASLRSIVSFGFALMDNGTSAIDALIGFVTVGIGQNGMEQFYMATGKVIPTGTDVEHRRPPLRAGNPRANATVTAEVRRQQLVEYVDNATMPRALRFDRLHELTFSSCGSVREMLFGPGQEVRDAFGRARTALARFPAEQAYVDLIQEAPNRIPEDDAPRSALDNLVMGAATVSGAVLNNPRIAACTRVALGSRQR